MLAVEVYAYYGLSYSADSLCSNAYLSSMLISGSDVLACLFASRASKMGAGMKNRELIWALNIKTEKHKTPTLRKGKDVNVNQLKMAFALSHPFVHNNRFLEVETWKMPGRNRAQFGSFLLGGICLMACALGTLDSIFVMTMAIIARMCSLGRGSSHLKTLKWSCCYVRRNSLVDL